MTQESTARQRSPRYPLGVQRLLPLNEQTVA